MSRWGSRFAIVACFRISISVRFNKILTSVAAMAIVTKTALNFMVDLRF